MTDKYIMFGFLYYPTCINIRTYYSPVCLDIFYFYIVLYHPILRLYWLILKFRISPLLLVYILHQTVWYRPLLLINIYGLFDYYTNLYWTTCHRYRPICLSGIINHLICIFNLFINLFDEIFTYIFEWI